MTNYKTIAAAAEHFDVTTKTLRRWITLGFLNAERLGPRLIRVDIDSMRSKPIQPQPFPAGSLSAEESLDKTLRAYGIPK